MKILLLLFLAVLSLNAFSNDAYNKCIEAVQIINLQIQEREQNQQQRYQALCRDSNDVMCIIEPYIMKNTHQALQQSMQRIQYHCAQKYGQQQQRQQYPQQQAQQQYPNVGNYNYYCE